MGIELLRIPNYGGSETRGTDNPVYRWKGTLPMALPLESTSAERTVCYGASRIRGGAVEYVIDTKASQFTVQAFASGLIS